MELEDARQDVVVAGTVAGCTVALTLLIRAGIGTDPGALLRASPIGVYALYLFSRKGTPDLAVDTARNWAVLTVLVALATLGYAVV